MGIESCYGRKDLIQGMKVILVGEDLRDDWQGSALLSVFWGISYLQASILAPAHPYIERLAPIVAEE